MHYGFGMGGGGHPCLMDPHPACILRCVMRHPVMRRAECMHPAQGPGEGCGLQAVRSCCPQPPSLLQHAVRFEGGDCRALRPPSRCVCCTNTKLRFGYSCRRERAFVVCGSTGREPEPAPLHHGIDRMQRSTSTGFGTSADDAGGFEYDGQQEISTLDEGSLCAALHEALALGISQIVVSGIFSPANPAHEEFAAGVLREEAKRVMGPTGEARELVGDEAGLWSYGCVHAAIFRERKLLLCLCAEMIVNQYLKEKFNHVIKKRKLRRFIVPTQSASRAHVGHRICLRCMINAPVSLWPQNACAATSTCNTAGCA
jgi:hypothetical protein